MKEAHIITSLAPPSSSLIKNPTSTQCRSSCFATTLKTLTTLVKIKSTAELSFTSTSQPCRSLTITTLPTNSALPKPSLSLSYTPSTALNKTAEVSKTTSKNIFLTTTDSKITSSSGTFYSSSSPAISQTMTQSNPQPIESSSTAMTTHSILRVPTVPPQQSIPSIPPESMNSLPGDFTQFSNHSGVLIGAIVGSVSLVVLVLLIFLLSRNNSSAPTQVQIATQLKHVNQRKQICELCKQSLPSIENRTSSVEHCPLKNGDIVDNFINQPLTPNDRKINSEADTQGCLWNRFISTANTNMPQESISKDSSFYCDSCSKKICNDQTFSRVSAKEITLPSTTRGSFKCFSVIPPVIMASDIEGQAGSLLPPSKFLGPLSYDDRTTNRNDSISSTGSSSIFIQLVCRDSTYYSSEQYDQVSSELNINENIHQVLQSKLAQNEIYWSDDYKSDEAQSPAKLESSTIPNYFFSPNSSLTVSDTML